MRLLPGWIVGVGRSAVLTADADMCKAEAQESH